MFVNFYQILYNLQMNTIENSHNLSETCLNSKTDTKYFFLYKLFFHRCSIISEIGTQLDVQHTHDSISEFD